MESRQLKSLDEFRKNVMGKPYSVAVKKFFTTKSEAPSQGNQARIDDNR